MLHIQNQTIHRFAQAKTSMVEALLRREMGRSIFCRMLNQQRAQVCSAIRYNQTCILLIEILRQCVRLGEYSFNTLCQLMRISLDECNTAKVRCIPNNWLILLLTIAQYL